MTTPEIVFIDTSIFVAENYLAPDNRINALGELAKKGKITLVMTEITCQEVRKHLQSDIGAAWRGFDRNCRPLRNNPVLDSWKRSTNERQEKEAALELFKAFLSDSKVIILGYDYCGDVEKVFSQYFGRRKPFGEGMKKDEFPDAFVLSALEKYSAEIRRKINILSIDSDLAKYESERLVHQEYGQFVSDKLKEDAALDALDARLILDKGRLEGYIRQEAEEFLDDFRIYMSYLSHLNVTGHDIKEVRAEVNPADYEIINLNPDHIEIELHPDVSFIVDVDYHDFDNATFDDEDRKWYGVEEGTYVIEATTPLTMTLRYFYPKGPQDVEALDVKDLDLLPLMDVIE